PLLRTLLCFSAVGCVSAEAHAELCCSASAARALTASRVPDPLQARQRVAVVGAHRSLDDPVRVLPGSRFDPVKFVRKKDSSAASWTRLGRGVCLLKQFGS